MKFIDVGKKLFIRDINDLQDKLKLKFTDDYCEFLLKNNGEMPEEEVEFTFLNMIN